MEANNIKAAQVDTVAALAQGDRGRPFALLLAVQRFAVSNPLAAFGALVIIALLVCALFGSAFTPHSYDSFDPRQRLHGPSSQHWFGSDHQGRDILSRIIYGAQITVTIGFGATAVSLLIASVLGLTSAYSGGAVDLVLQRVIEVMQAFPGLIFLTFMVSIFGRSKLDLALVLGVLFAAGSSRVVRSGVLGLMSEPYILAARSLGASGPRVVVRHVLPNVVPILIVIASVQIGAVVLAESSLSFLGFGVPPPFPSWGRMLNEALPYIRQHEYLAYASGSAIALVVYAFNMLGDGLRDALDPRLRGRR